MEGESAGPPRRSRPSTAALMYYAVRSFSFVRSRRTHGQLIPSLAGGRSGASALPGDSMYRVQAVVIASVLGLTAAVGLGQGTSGLTADAFKNIELRSLGPNYTTGRVQDIAVDPESSERLLRGVRGRRAVEKRESRQHVDADLRQRRLLQPLLRRRSIRRTRTSCGSARVRTRTRAARWSAPASTSRPTAARRGRASGLENSEHIGKIKIDPRNSNTVYRRRAGPAVVLGRRPRHLQDDRRRHDVEEHVCTRAPTRARTTS